METNEYQQIVIKTEVEEAEDPHEESNYLSQARDSILGGTETNLINIKLEPGIKQEDQNEEFILASECKLEMKVEVNNEDCNSHTKFKPDVVDGSPNMTDEILDGSETKSVIHSNDSESGPHRPHPAFGPINMEDNEYHQIFIKAEVEEAEESCNPCEESNLIDVKLEPGIKLEDQNEEFMLASEDNLEMNAETNDECCNPDTRSINSEDMADDSEIMSASQSTEPRNFKHNCDKCDYMTNNLSHFKRHYKTHSDEKPFKCDECAFRTKTKSGLHRHRYIHTDEKPFKCDKCDYSSATKSNIKLHQLAHTELRPFRCDKCSFQCKSENYLKKHQLVHVKVKPFACDKCSYRAKDKVHLKRHSVTHLESRKKLQEADNENLVQKLSEIRPFKCDKCSYRSKTKEVLKEHLVVHTELRPFKCDKCFYRAKRKICLTLHQRKVHTLNSSRQYCDKCSYRTKFKLNLDQHRLIHNKESSEEDKHAHFILSESSHEKKITII